MAAMAKHILSTAGNAEKLRFVVETMKKAVHHHFPGATFGLQRDVSEAEAQRTDDLIGCHELYDARFFPGAKYDDGDRPPFVHLPFSLPDEYFPKDRALESWQDAERAMKREFYLMFTGREPYTPDDVREIPLLASVSRVKGAQKPGQDAGGVLLYGTPKKHLAKQDVHADYVLPGLVW